MNTETQKVAVLSLYTTRQYIRDLVKMAREANATGIKRMQRIHTFPAGRSFLIKGAKWQFEFARQCMADARKAKSEKAHA